MTALINSKEMRRSIGLCGTPFSLHYFKPSSFKDMDKSTVLEMKLIVKVLADLYSETTNKDSLSEDLIGYVEEKISKLLALSQRCGYRVLMLNAPFNAIGVFVFGENFSMVNYFFFGGKTAGFYSMTFTNIQELAKETEKKLMEEGKNGTTDYTDR